MSGYINRSRKPVGSDKGLVGSTPTPIAKQIKEMIPLYNTGLFAVALVFGVCYAYLTLLADTNVKTWIDADDGDGIVCPHCGEDFCTLIHETYHFHFCPNCGKPVRLNLKERDESNAN